MLAFGRELDFELLPEYLFPSLHVCHSLDFEVVWQESRHVATLVFETIG